MGVATLALILVAATGMTPIRVTNTWRKEVNVKIKGEGVGGCDVVLTPGQTDR
jgi:hypothetical protein